MSVDEFFQTFENTTKIGNWGPKYKIQIVVLKLIEVENAFGKRNFELQANYITWDNFKQNFLRRFRNVINDPYHFTKLQTARQKRDESLQEFADRCG